MLAMLYATYIVKGMKTFNEVPNLLKPEVKKILIDMDMGHLAE